MRTEVQLDKVEEFERVLGALPVYPTEKVTKADAVRRSAGDGVHRE